MNGSTSTGLSPKSNFMYRHDIGELYHLDIENSQYSALRFTGEDSDKKVTAAFLEVFTNGSKNNIVDACLALLRSCQDTTLPESTRDDVKSLLLSFLDAILGSTVPTDHSSAGCSVDKLITQSLQKLVNKKFEQIDLIVKDQQLLLKAPDPAKDRYYQSGGSHLSAMKSESYDHNAKQIKVHIKAIQQIYSYQTSPEHADHQILDDVFELVMDGKFETAKIIGEVLIELTENPVVKTEAQILINIIPTVCQNVKNNFIIPTVCKNVKNNFLDILLECKTVTTDFLNFVINTDKRPKAASWLREIHSNSRAKPGCPESNIDDKTLVTELEEIVEQRKKEIAFEKESYNICLNQTSIFSIHFHHSIEKRIELANYWLITDKRGVGFTLGHHHNEVLKAVIILESFSKLDHPSTLQAKKLLDAWLSAPKNRLWLINQYGILLADYRSENNTFREYKNNFEKHIHSLLQQVHTFKEQGEADKAQQLVYQLIDTAIGLEHVDRGNVLPICSFFYQHLQASPDINEACQIELAVRQGSRESKTNFARDAIPECLIVAANTPGRPNAAYQVARIYVPYPYVDGKLNTQPKQEHSNGGAWSKFDHRKLQDIIVVRRTSPIDCNDTARNIQKANHYFQIAANEGCSLLNGEQDALNRIIRANTNQAQHLMNKGDLIWAKWDFETSGLAGDVEAHLMFLKLSVTEKENVEAQFELGKLYLTGSETPFLKQDISEGKKLLETTVENGYVKAAILVAQHYSTHTPHQPKFPTAFYSSPNDKAMEFLKIAVESGFEKEKQKIYENEIPDYLNEMVKQLHPNAIEIVFNLSEQYENGLFQWEKDLKLASVLLKIAVEAKLPKALTKMQALEDKLGQELQIKLKLKMEEAKQALEMEQELERAKQGKEKQALEEKLELERQEQEKKKEQENQRTIKLESIPKRDANDFDNINDDDL